MTLPTATQRRSSVHAYTSLAPLAFIVSFLLVIPLGVSLWNSFREGSIFGMTSTLTLENYTTVLTRESFWLAMKTSIALGLASAAVSLVLGFIIAHHLRFRSPRARGVIVGALLLAIVGGYLVRIYAWRTLLGETGIINTGLIRLNIIHEPLGWLLFSPQAVVLTFASLYVPYATLMLVAGLQNVRDEEVEAARDLGAKGIRSYRIVVLPLIGRSIMLAFSLIFLLSASDYVIPRLMGSASTQTFGVFVANQFISTGDAASGAAYGYCALVVLVLVLLAAWLLARIGGLLPRHTRGVR